jgi:hypothetical protein
MTNEDREYMITMLEMLTNYSPAFLEEMTDERLEKEYTERVEGR